ncbi:MAG: hypothetical protein RR829_01820, partial [Oscillospiraceae bacterium]
MSSVTITEIKQTKRGRYALFCADGFMFSIDEDTVARHHVKKGMQLENEQLMQILRCRHLELMSWNELSEHMGLGPRWLQRLHKRALAQL